MRNHSAGALDSAPAEIRGPSREFAALNLTRVRAGCNAGLE